MQLNTVSYGDVSSVCKYRDLSPEANQAASNQCCDTLPGCPRCDPHQDAWKQLPRLTMDASETEAKNRSKTQKTQPRGSNSALSTNTYRVQMWRRISDAHVISCKRMFPASPVAGFNSASIVPVSTGSISVSTSNPPGIQKIIIFSNKKSLYEIFTTKLFNSSVLSLFFIFPTTVCSDLFQHPQFSIQGNRPPSSPGPSTEAMKPAFDQHQEPLGCMKA